MPFVLYDRLRRLTNVLDALVEAITSGLLAALIMLTVAEIVGRNFFSYSLFWAFEINQLLGNWMYFLGIGLIYHRAQDITLDLFFERLRPETRRYGLLGIHILSLVVLSVLAYESVLLVDIQSERRTTGLGIRNHLYSLPILIGVLIMMLCVARHALAVALRIADDPGNRQ